MRKFLKNKYKRKEINLMSKIIGINFKKVRFYSKLI